MKILAADEEIVNLEDIQIILEDEGYEVVTLEDGEEVWDYLLANEDIDLLVLGCAVPGIDGIELTSKIKHHSKLRHIPIIIQSGKLTEDEIQQGLDAGANFGLKKPFVENELLSLIEEAATH